MKKVKFESEISYEPIKNYFKLKTEIERGDYFNDRLILNSEYLPKEIKNEITKQFPNVNIENNQNSVKYEVSQIDNNKFAIHAFVFDKNSLDIQLDFYTTIDNKELSNIIDNSKTIQEELEHVDNKINRLIKNSCYEEAATFFKSDYYKTHRNLGNARSDYELENICIKRGVSPDLKNYDLTKIIELNKDENTTIRTNDFIKGFEKLLETIDEQKMFPQQYIDYIELYEKLDNHDYETYELPTHGYNSEQALKVEFLKEHLNTPNLEGKTILDVALENKNELLTKSLINLGAKTSYELDIENFHPITEDVKNIDKENNAFSIKNSSYLPDHIIEELKERRKYDDIDYNLNNKITYDKIIQINDDQFAVRGKIDLALYEGEKFSTIMSKEEVEKLLENTSKENIKAEPIDKTGKFFDLKDNLQFNEIKILIEGDETLLRTLKNYSFEIEFEKFPDRYGTPLGNEEAFWPKNDLKEMVGTSQTEIKEIQQLLETDTCKNLFNRDIYLRNEKNEESIENFKQIYKELFDKNPELKERIYNELENHNYYEQITYKISYLNDNNYYIESKLDGNDVDFHWYNKHLTEGERFGKIINENELQEILTKHQQLLLNEEVKTFTYPPEDFEDRMLYDSAPEEEKYLYETVERYKTGETGTKFILVDEKIENLLVDYRFKEINELMKSEHFQEIINSPDNPISCYKDIYSIMNISDDLSSFDIEKFKNAYLTSDNHLCEKENYQNKIAEFKELLQTMESLNLKFETNFDKINNNAIDEIKITDENKNYINNSNETILDIVIKKGDLETANELTNLGCKTFDELKPSEIINIETQRGEKLFQALDNEIEGIVNKVKENDNSTGIDD